MIGRLRDVSVGAWAVLAVLIASCAAIVIWAPTHFWQILSTADPAHIAGVITLVGGAFVGVFVQWRRARPPARVRPWERPGYDDEDPTPAQSPRAMDRRDRPPGTTSTRPRREGSARPPTLIGVALVAGILSLCALLAAGCGASPTRVHASIATVSIDTARVARQLLLDAMERRIADCAERELAVRAVCLDSAEATDRALGATLDAALLAIDVYRGEVAASHARGDDPETASVVLGRSQAYAAAHWNTFLELGRASGVPVDVLTGGES